MLRNYLKLAVRQLLGNKLVSTINIVGLCIAIGCSITVFLFLKNYWTMDNFHVNGERIFMTECVLTEGGEEKILGHSPMPLAAALTAEFPQVERAVRIHMESARVFREDQTFQETVLFADTGFLQMFTFPLKSGDPLALTDPDAVILSANAAEKFFGKTDPVGQEIRIVFDNREQRGCTVKGVAQPFPDNAGLTFDILAGFQAFETITHSGAAGWKDLAKGTFLQVRRPEDIAALSGNMDKYVALHNSASPDMPIKSIVFDNLRHPNPGAYDVLDRPAEAAHPLLTLLFSLMALLMIALACFNYINISLGFANRRLKEIGVRKVIGGQKRQLIAQFMSENLLLCSLALLLGLALAELIFVPLFNSIFVMNISLSFAGNPALWLFLAGLLAFTGVASGAYPAFYISSFQPVSILKGKQEVSGKSRFSSVLLTMQFVLAFSTVILGVVLTLAGRYWENLSWGYQPGQTLMVRLENARQFERMKQELVRDPSVLQVAGAAHHVGESFAPTTLFAGADTLEAIRYDIGAGYCEALGLRLRAGQFFDLQRKEEDVNKVVVNETFVNDRQWDDPLGREIRLEGKTYTIAGVVDDFKFMGSGGIRPTVFRLADPGEFGYLALRYQAGKAREMEDLVKAVWKKLDPATPVSWFHQDAVFDNFNQSYAKAAGGFGYIAGLALLIACMGLFGLATQHYASRRKSVSIRKVMGASTTSLVLLSNRQFIRILVIASVIATGICFVGVRQVIHMAEEFTGKLDLGITPYLLANLLVFLTAATAVGWQSYQLAAASPVEALRSE